MFGQHWYNDISLLQLSRPLSPGYCTVQASDADVELVYGFEGWQSAWGVLTNPGPRPLVTVKEGRLEEGDTITITLGDRSAESPGLLMQSFTTDALTFRFEIDFQLNGLFVPVGLPRFQVLGTDPDHRRLIAPTTVKPEETFKVKVSVEDQYFNRAVGGPRNLKLFQGYNQVAAVSSLPSDPATFHFDGRRWPEGHEGPLTYEAKDDNKTLWGKSNPSRADR